MNIMELKVFEIFVVLFAMNTFVKCDVPAAPAASLYCSDLNPQNSVDIDQVSVYG